MPKSHLVKSPTMRDVAQLAGVSQPTVSRVLNDTSSAIPISDETRQKVMDAVRQLKYRPNMTARSLRTQRTQMIALMIADITNPFYHPIAGVVQDIARQHDYDVIISNSRHHYDNEKHFIEAVTRRPVDGVIMVPIHLTDEDIDRFIAQTRTPVVVIGVQIKHPKVDVVWADDEKATFEAITWLIEERHYDRIGFLGVPEIYPPGKRRWRGFQAAMERAGLPVNMDHVSLMGDFTLESGRRAAQEFVKLPSWPSAMFVVNDLMAIGFMLALQDVGYNVPGDIAVMGFDDIPEASIIRPALTTMAQTPADIGEKLVTALFDRIEGRITSGKRILESPCILIPRQSA